MRMEQEGSGDTVQAPTSEMAGQPQECAPPMGARPTKNRGLGRVYQRGNVWWVQFSFRGKVYRETTGSAKRTAATALLKKRLSEIGRGRLIGPVVEKTTFEKLSGMLLNDYRNNGRKSLRRATSSVEHLKKFFADSRAIDITTDRIDAYIRSRFEAEHPAAPATVRNELAALKRMFTLGIRAGLVVERPYITSLEVHNTRKGFFEEPEFRAVVDHLGDHLRPVVQFAYLTGWRIGEILPLSWSQVDFAAGTVRLEPGTTKNGEGRTFPFGTYPALHSLLKAQRACTSVCEIETGKIIPHVFHRNGKRVKDFRLAWHKACDAAGLSGRLVHDLRRTAVRNLERAGVPRSVAMKLTGHKTESIYRRYAIVDEADLSEGVGKLARLHAEMPANSTNVVPMQSQRQSAEKA